MGTELQLRWLPLNITIRVRLLEDLNPGLTNDLRLACPLASIQSHAVVAGKQIYFPTRLLLPDPQTAFTEPMNNQPPGRLNFEPFFQYIAINYGPVSEPVPAFPIAQVVDEDIPRLLPLGKLIWENLMSRQPPFLVVVEQVDAPPSTLRFDPAALHRATPLELTAATWQDVVTYLKAEIDAIWLTEPEDVRALRLGVNASDAGVYDQYFSPWVMATGLIRSLGVVELASLLRLANNPDFSVNHLTTLLREMLRLTLGVIGFFGLPDLMRALAAVNQTVEQISRLEDFKTLIAALISYVNRYNLWLHQTFPWYLGGLFPKASLENAQTIQTLSSRYRTLEKG